MKRNKKGQVMTFANGPNIILLFGLIVLIAAAVAVAVNSFRDTQTTDGYAYNVSQDGLTGLSNFSDQIPTVGTILGVALIIVVVVGAFAFGMIGRRGGGL